MKQFIVFDILTGYILRTGSCPDGDFNVQANVADNEAVIKGSANDSIQKINITTKKVIDKTQAEIDANKPTPIPLEDQEKILSNKEYQNILVRLTALESN